MPTMGRMRQNNKILRNFSPKAKSFEVNLKLLWLIGSNHQNVYWKPCISRDLKELSPLKLANRPYSGMSLSSKITMPSNSILLYFPLHNLLWCLFKKMTYLKLLWCAIKTVFFVVENLFYPNAKCCQYFFITLWTLLFVM